MSKTFEIRADKMNLGLDLNTDLLEPGKISRGTSVRFQRGTGIQTGTGYRFSATPNGESVPGGLCEATIVRDTLWGKFGTKIMYSHNSVDFYDTGNTMTDGELQGIAEGIDGDVFASNQVDSNIRFAVGLLQSVVLDTDVTITVGSVYISKFAASGTVYIRGDAITYSGKNATQLTGVSGIQAGGHPSGEIVVQSSTPSNWSAKGNILVVYQADGATPMLILSGMKTNPSQVSWGGVFSNSNPEYFYDLNTTANGAGTDFMSSKVESIVTGTAAGYVILDKGVTKITGIDSTTGGLTFKQINSQYGAYNRGCAVDMDGVVCFMGRKRLMPIVLSITPESQSVSELNEAFDKDIRPWLDSHDDVDLQNSAFLKWDSTQKLLKIGAVVNGELQCYVYDAQQGRFLGNEQRKIGSSIMFKGQSYFAHIDNGNLYLDDVGRSNDGVQISHIIRTGRNEYDKGRRWLEGIQFYNSGFMMRGTVFTFRIYIDGSSLPSFEQEFDDSLIVNNSGRSIGLRTGGLSTPGGSLNEVVTVYEYNLPILMTGLQGEDFCFEWEIANDGGFLTFDSWYASFLVPKYSPRIFQ